MTSCLGGPSQEVTIVGLAYKYKLRSPVKIFIQYKINRTQYKIHRTQYKIHRIQYKIHITQYSEHNTTKHNPGSISNR